MFGSLFKPDWQSRSVEKRMQAVQEMSAQSSENQDIFLKVVNQDSDASLRQTALQKLSDPLVVYRLSKDHSDQEIRSLAHNKFGYLTGPKSQLDIAEFKNLITNIPECADQLVLSAPHKELRTEYIESLSEAHQIDLLAKIEYSNTRKQIVERINSISSLELARKALKGRDKTAEKIVKGKLDSLRAEQRRIDDNNAHAESLLEKMEYIESHEWQPDFKARYKSCKQQWEKLELSPETSIKQRFQDSSKLIEAKVNELDKIEAASNTQTTLAVDIETQAKQLANLTEEELIVLNADSFLSEKLSGFATAWKNAEKILRPNLNIADQYLAAEQALSSVSKYLDNKKVFIEKQAEKSAAEKEESSEKNPSVERPAVSQAHLNSKESTAPKITAWVNKQIRLISWPRNYPELTLLSQLTAQLSDLEQDQEKTKKEAKDQLDRLHKKISSIQGMASRGNIGRAKRELETAIASSEKYKAREKSALDERLEKVKEAVSKMGDWKDFAIEPKYLELCENMEALVGSKENPDKLAEQISILQANWKKLGYSESSENHWGRFKEAGDKAYEPCGIFFTERKEKRRENLQKREPYIEQMESILANTNWDFESTDEKPDYKNIEQTIRSISNDWRKIKDVEQGADQKQWKRFSEIRNAVYEKMDVVYDANLAAKRSLVEQVSSLLETDVREELFSSLQQLQLRWKQIGITRRKEDQLVWAEFKKLTDELYDKIRALRNEKKAEDDAQINAYKDIIQKIRDLAKNAKDLSGSDTIYEQLEADFKALPELPKQFSEKLIEGIEKDFNRAKETYSNTRERIIKSAKNKELDALIKKAKVCTQLEKLPSNSPEDEVESLMASMEAQVMSDKQLIERFQQRVEVARQAEFDREEVGNTRRNLCVELEILLEVESPKEDKNLRMNIQLERMKSQGIGRSQISKEEQIAEYKLDWLCLPGAKPELQESLDKRFFKLLG